MVQIIGNVLLSWEENIVFIVLKKTVREKQGQVSGSNFCTTFYVL